MPASPSIGLSAVVEGAVRGAFALASCTSYASFCERRSRFSFLSCVRSSRSTRTSSWYCLSVFCDAQLPKNKKTVEARAVAMVRVVFMASGCKSRASRGGGGSGWDRDEGLLESELVDEPRDILPIEQDDSNTDSEVGPEG